MGINSLVGENIQLRALEPEDLAFLYELENDEKVWEVSHTQTPYSKYVLKEYLANAHKDIFEVKQLRLAIVNKSEEKLIGFIDLFDFDPRNARAGVGVIVYGAQQQRKGYASEALELLLEYAQKHLHMHQLYANIGAANTASIALFEGFHFKLVGIKKDWLKTQHGFLDELLYQKIYES